MDRRWSSVPLPRGTNYLPFADGSTFTAADWLHLMIYTGRWIMNGILRDEKLDVWLRLCRVFEVLSQHTVDQDPSVQHGIMKLVTDTVAFCEVYLPITESTIQFHNLIHLTEDIFDKGPTHGFWMFRLLHYLRIDFFCTFSLSSRSDSVTFSSHRIFPPVTCTLTCLSQQ